MAASKQYAVSMLIKADNRVGGPVKSAIGQFNRLGNKVAHVSRMAGFHKVGASVRGLSGDVMRLGGMVRSSMAPLLGLGGLASVGGLVALTNSTARSGDEFAKLSTRLGMTSERLQGLAYATDRNGAGFEQFKTGMRDLAKNIGEASAGTGEAQAVFKSLGISLTDASGRVKTSEEVFLELSDVLPKIKDASLRLAVAQKVMGESGGVMVNTLMQGRTEIERLIKEKQRLGVITNAQAKSYEEFVDSQTRASSAIQGMGYSIVNHLMPYAGPAIDRFTDWIVTNKEFIGQNVGGVIERIGTRLEGVDWQGAVSGVADFVSWTGSAIQFIGGFDNALMLGGAVMAGPFVAATAQAAWGALKLAGSVGMATANVVSFVAVQSVGAVVSFFQAVRSGVGVVHALNFALAANPVGVVIAGLTALGAVGYGLYKHFKPFKDLIDTIWGGIKNLASVAGDWLQDALGVDFSAFDDVKKGVASGINIVTGQGPATPPVPPSFKPPPGGAPSGVAYADQYLAQNMAGTGVGAYPLGPGNRKQDPVSGYANNQDGLSPVTPNYGDLTALAPVTQSAPTAQEITVKLLGFPENTEVDHKSDGGSLTAFNVVLDTGASTVGGA